MWVEAFKSIAKTGKKSKKSLFIDETNPVETIDEVIHQLRTSYPDLIIGF